MDPNANVIKIDQLADYIVYKLVDDTSYGVSLLKLQKLAYYAQAWHLALKGRRLVDEGFQAWVHGPVSRRLYDRFGSNALFEVVSVDKITEGFNPEQIPAETREFIDEVIDEYGKFSGSQLETLTHGETPWQAARGGIPPLARCENVIDEKLMADFYRARRQSA